MAAIVISALPISILFVSLQKYFIKGMTAGAVKG
jgi:raffinose/stachyose/melibiose transport system permease protein